MLEFILDRLHLYNHRPSASVDVSQKTFWSLSNRAKKQEKLGAGIGRNRKYREVNHLAGLAESDVFPDYRLRPCVISSDVNDEKKYVELG